MPLWAALTVSGTDQWCRSIPGQSLSLIKLWAPARAEVRGEVLGMLFLQPLPGPQNYHGCWERYLDIRQERPQFMSWRWHHGQYLNCPHSPMHVWSLLQAETLGSSGLSTLKKKNQPKSIYLHSRAIRVPCSHKESQPLLRVCLMN